MWVKVTILLLCIWWGNWKGEKFLGSWGVFDCLLWHSCPHIYSVWASDFAFWSNKQSKIVVVVLGTPRRPNSRATPQGLDQRPKLEEVVPKMVRQRRSGVGQSWRRWIRFCRGSPQALHEEFSFGFILHREAVTVAAKLGQFTADETGKGQFLRGNRRNLVGERVARKILSPQRIASVSNLCNGRCQWAGNMSNRECYSGFGERVCPFISGKSNMTGDPLEA